MNEASELQTKVNRQSIKKTNPTSRHHAQRVGLFNTKICALLLLVAAGILARPSWQALHSYVNSRTIESQLERLIRLEGLVMYRDEVLAMSAKMAAATGNLKWVSRHEDFGPRVMPIVDEKWHVSENEDVEAGVILAAFADDKLVTMENKALDLVRQGKHDHAEILLQSPEYEEQRRAYNGLMNELVRNV